MFSNVGQLPQLRRGPGEPARSLAAAAAAAALRGAAGLTQGRENKTEREVLGAEVIQKALVTLWTETSKTSSQWMGSGRGGEIKERMGAVAARRACAHARRARAHI